MRVPHVLVPATDDKLHHLRRVLRLHPGAELSLTDGHGGAAAGVLTDAGIEEGDWSYHDRDAGVVLCPAVSKGTKLDLVIEKATELGVAGIQPVLCARSERSWDERARASRLRRWRTIAVAALEQSRGLWLPDVSAPADFSEVVGVLDAPGLLFDPAGTIADFGAAAARRLAVGPEGGFTDAEIEAAVGAGWRVCSLGARVLRTETAAIVVCALALAARGHFESGAPG